VHTVITVESIESSLLLNEKLLLPLRRAAAAAPIQDLEDHFVQLPWPMGIGVAQRRALRSLRQAQMPKLAFARRQTLTDLPQRVRSSQLAEHHRDELSPAREAPTVTLGLMELHRSLEFQSRIQLQDLTEDACYSGHRRSPLGLVNWFLQESHSPYQSLRSFC
jgi:hypothetical protein